MCLTFGKSCDMLFTTSCRYSLVVESQLPKLVVRVRFPLPAPKRPFVAFFSFRAEYRSIENINSISWQNSVHSSESIK